MRASTATNCPRITTAAITVCPRSVKRTQLRTDSDSLARAKSSPTASQPPSELETLPNLLNSFNRSTKIHSWPRTKAFTKICKSLDNHASLTSPLPCRGLQDFSAYKKNFKKKTPFTQWSNAYFSGGVFFNPPTNGIWDITRPMLCLIISPLTHS